MNHKKTQLYTLNDVRTGKAVEFCISPMSGNPMFRFVPVVRATPFKRHEAQAAACLLSTVLPDAAGYLSIEEAKP